MRDDNTPGEESRFDSSNLPEAVQRLADAMLGVDPTWKLVDWLNSKAEEEIKLLSLDLQRELLQAEQRLHRVEALSRRLDIDISKSSVETGQKNLFDCFDIVQRGLLNPAETKEKNIESDEFTEIGGEVHPASLLTNYLPGEDTDDPLLAITAQHVLLQISNLMDENMGVAPAEKIFQELNARQINDDEINEAINYLLMQASIIEIDEDIFTLNEE